ncbi:MAG: 4Fe-4S dicluster domain-containing protein [Candidatus Lokiarchaeota archaeon]|nr:4Fe-4S dicluster domain-containing protein [Candidatus Lokiarchaeota archaeon]
MSKNLWYKLARAIIKAGKLPIPIAEKLYELLKLLITEDQAKFLLIFNKKPALNIHEIEERVEMDHESIKKMLDELMRNGIITGTFSESNKVMVYRLKPPFPGIFEAQFMRGETGIKQKKIAKIFEELFEEWSIGIQKNYENMVDAFKRAPPITRTIPVSQEIEIGIESVIPMEKVNNIIDKNEHVAVTNCYCRHEKILLKDPCKLNATVRNCFLFGKNAQFSIEYGFAEPISKYKAKEILKEAEAYGLVHKAFHIHQDPERAEDAICNCCKCCCGTYQLHYKGVAPIHTLSSYTVKLNEKNCVGCGTCVEKCPMEAITLQNDLAILEMSRCVGCGVCVHQCPNEAIELERIGPREIFIPPPKLAVNLKN